PSSTLFPYTTLFRSIIAPFTCDWHRRSGFRGTGQVRTRVLGASSGVPLPAAGSGRTAARGGPSRGVRRILARSLGSESHSMKIRSEEHTSELQSLRH